MLVNRDSSIYLNVSLFSPAQFHVQWKVKRELLNRMNKLNIVRTAAEHESYILHFAGITYNIEMHCGNNIICSGSKIKIALWTVRCFVFLCLLLYSSFRFYDKNSYISPMPIDMTRSTSILLFCPIFIHIFFFLFWICRLCFVFIMFVFTSRTIFPICRWEIFPFICSKKVYHF